MIGVDEKLGQQAPLDLEFYDEEGDLISLRDAMGGKPTVLALVFFTCDGICTPLLNGLAQVIEQTPSMSPGEDYQIITISFDPQDGPARAKTKRESYLEMVDRDIDPAGWRFLTGSQNNIDTLCDTVGFRYIEQDGTFIHSGVLILLSPEGKVVRYLHGSNVNRRNIMPFLPLEFRLALIEASEGRVGPTVNKVLRLCFQYDQAGKRYVLDVTKISMIIVLIGALVVLLYVTVFSRIGRDRDTTKGDTTKGSIPKGDATSGNQEAREQEEEDNQ